MQKSLAISVTVFFFFVYGLYLSRYDVRVLEDVLTPIPSSDYYDYRGATHIHSDRNLGSGSYADIIAQAQNAAMDYIVFTDLNDYEPRLTDVAGYHRKLLVIAGSSHSYLDSTLLVYGPGSPLPMDSRGQAQMTLADLLSQSGADADQNLLVLAHPFKPGYSWTGEYPSGLDGIEVINLKSAWQNTWNTSKTSFFWSLLVYPFNSQLALLRLYEEPRAEISLWDTLNSRKKTIGFAGSEATARTGSVGNFYLRFPSYEVTFGLLSNHVLLRSELTGEPESDTRKIFDALNGGQFYMSIDLLGNPKGFLTYLTDGDRTHLMGETAKFRKGLILYTRLPRTPRTPFEVVVLKDGERVKTFDTPEGEFAVTSPGVYRVFVRVIPTFPLPDGKRWITWIYTNPIRVQ